MDKTPNKIHVNLISPHENNKHNSTVLALMQPLTHLITGQLS